MRIGIVSSYFYPWYGGITEHVYHQYKELKRRGYDVKIITPFDGGELFKQKEDIIRIGRPVPLILNGSANHIPLLPKGKRIAEGILDRERFDILHFHQPLFCVLAHSFLHCIRKRKRLGERAPRVVGTFHASGGGKEKFLIKLFWFHFHQFRHDFDHRIAVSRVSREFISPILPGTYSIIPNGVDLTRFSPRGSKIPLFDDGVFNILFVGRMEPRKGISALLRSVPLIPRHTDIPFRLIVVGNGFFSDYYRHRIPRESAEKIVFTGNVPFADLPAYYRSAHLFCSPALCSESFGIVLIEAMASGLPVVAGDNAGYRAIIRDGDNGMLINPRNPEDMAKRIGTLINSEYLRKKFAAKGLEEVKKYGWPVIMDRMESVYSYCSVATNGIPG